MLNRQLSLSWFIAGTVSISGVAGRLELDKRVPGRCEFGVTSEGPAYFVFNEIALKWGRG